VLPTLLLGLLLLPTASRGQTPPGDSYLCYKSTLASSQAQFTPVQKTLEDQLRTLVADVESFLSVCNPLLPAVVRPDIHPVSYNIRVATIPPQPKFLKSVHTAIDEFGSHPVTLTQPVDLRAPSAQVPGAGGTGTIDTTGVDHFECYRALRAKGAPNFIAPPPVTITDEFGTVTLTLKKLTKLCTPVNKNGEDPTAPQHVAHLACYQAKAKLPAGGTLGASTVSVNNTNFGPAVLVAKEVAELCVPAFKDTIPSPTTTPQVAIDGHQYGEGVIALDPGNPLHVVAAGIGFASTGAYYSNDGGTTWQIATIPSSRQTLNDPTIAFGSTGNVFVTTWGQDANYPGDDGILLYKSTDGGQSYNSVTAIALEDHMTQAPLTLDAKGNLITLQDGSHLRIDQHVVPNRIYVDFGAHTAVDTCCTAIAYSDDGGVTFSIHIQNWAGNESVSPSGVLYSLAPPFLYKSSDDGTTVNWSLAFNQMPVDNFGFGNWGWTGFVVDSSDQSPYRGNLYAAYGDGSRDGGDVFFRRSTDGGNTWSAPIIVNDDPFPGPYCSGRTPQYLSNVNVAPNGRIDVVWYDRRNDPFAADCNADAGTDPHYADLYYAYSIDGGRTFSANIRLSNQSTYSAGDYIWVASGNDRAMPWWTQFLPGVPPYDTGGAIAYTSVVDFGS
jgi:hypothetical protein